MFFKVVKAISLYEFFYLIFTYKFCNWDIFELKLIRTFFLISKYLDKIKRFFLLLLLLFSYIFNYESRQFASNELALQGGIDSNWILIWKWWSLQISEITEFRYSVNFNIVVISTTTREFKNFEKQKPRKFTYEFCLILSEMRNTLLVVA